MAQVPVAIVGVSALFPGSSDMQGFWRDILAGRDLITDVPASHWLIEDYYDPDPTAPDKTYCKRGAFLGKIPFDPMEFGVPPNIVPATDTAQLLALIVAQKVLEDASQGQFSKLDRERTSVILGVTSAQELLGSLVSRLQRPVWLKALRESGIPESEAERICKRIADEYVPWQEASFPGLLGNVVAGRIANRFDLRGTNTVTDAACASALSAISVGVNELLLGQSDLVITGGVDTMNDIFMFVCFSKTPALSKTGDCRPFSDAADGTLLGEGLAMFALKRLKDAERDGDRIYAVIRGIGSSSDGRSKSVYAPAAEGQARALRRAYATAGLSPSSVELVEAHGTGTKAGDVAEFEGLRLAFGESGRSDAAWCALGTVKSQIGHTKAAAGAAGLLKATLALRHGVFPPTIKVDRPNPKLDLDRSPFYLNTKARPWVRDQSHPRRAGVSSFGFGGSNFHVVVEEYAGPGKRARRIRTVPSELVLVHATSADALVQQARELVASGRDLISLARQSQLDFSAKAPFRLAVVAGNKEELQARIAEGADRIAKDKKSLFVTPQGTAYGTGARDGRVAFLFPGQGSQYLEMGADVAMAFEPARSAWDDAAQHRFDGLGLHEVVFPPPVFDEEVKRVQQARLLATEWAQPAIGAVSMSLLRLLDVIGLHADAAAGHSFGAVTALFAAGVIDRDGFLGVARRRGELMRDAASTASGAMVAIAADIDAVQKVLERMPATERPVIANHNAPSQVVVSGTVEAIDRLESALRETGLSGKRLKVATAFHSPLVAPSTGPFRIFLGGVPITGPLLLVYGNADATPYPSDPAAIRERLATQIASPVRFVDSVEAMYADGVRTFVEVGPASVLTDFVGRILGDRPHLALALDRKGKSGVTALQEALGRLAVAGLELDFRALWEDAGEARAASEPKKSTMTIPLSGINYGKPYPPEGGAKALPPPNEGFRPDLQPDASNLEWVRLYQEAQQQTADAHATYQKVMAETHLAFLRTVENSFAGLQSMVSGDRVAPVARTVEAPMAREAAAVVPVVGAPPVPVPELTEVAAPNAAANTKLATKNASSVGSLDSVLLDVVAEKTGYPKEMLGLEMELEADLGIDSIKRVEILSALRERVPGLPEVETGEMAALRTLGQIVARVKESTTSTSTSTSTNSTTALEATLLAVVAEKTGYPAEMLGLDMELEADLGIDSIKRVEILSALREREPGLPEVEAGEMGALRTLGQIVLRLRAAADRLETGDRRLEEQQQIGEDSLKSSRSVHRFVVELVPAREPGLAPTGLWGERVFVTDDGTGLGNAVVERFRAVGFRADLVAEVPGDARVVVFLGGLRLVASADEAVAVNREAFRVARRVAKGFSERGGVFVTVQDTGGDFGLSGAGTRAWLAGVAGLARTAAVEWDRATVRAIDIARGARSDAELADALVYEILNGGAEREIAIDKDGARCAVRGVERAAGEGGGGRLTPESVIVVSGGARGVTAACVIALAEETRARFVLLGRSAMEEEPSSVRGIEGEAELKRALLEEARRQGRTPSPTELGNEAARLLAGREIRNTVATIERAGGKARYIAVDVQDRRALSGALEVVRREWGPVTGIVHGAGVLFDKRITDKTDAQFDRVFDTKVAGLRALLETTAGDPVENLVVFSSVAARVGNAGQCDYAMANEVLNKVAIAESIRREGRCRVKSLGFGPWEGGMVTPSLRRAFEQRGVALIPLDAGAQAFVQEIGGSSSEIELVLGASADASALGAKATGAVSLEVNVSRANHPYLDGHRIGGRAVVPVALALEWFARAASACRPDLAIGTIRDLRVLRGIRLEHFEGPGDRFRVNARELSNGEGATLSLELRAEDDSLRYIATAEMVLERAKDARVSTLLRTKPWTQKIYDGHVLFHGKAFQVIERIEGVSEEGIAGTLVGVRERGWAEEPWRTDPAAVDGGLQLAVLWARVVSGGASLPMAIAAYRPFIDAPVGGAMRCVAHARKVSDGGAVCDIVFSTADGNVVAELLGVETVVRPGEKAEPRAALV